ncbi:MAG TPA: SDR family NAD(P)-dependent oxidoreductase [Candidatus Polarisedimenticolaceae bacterium]|nr:SDR family NAD(P)-dependent oxidoreductase [Candidatus Polarisedimenticolaceae bacterium]
MRVVVITGASSGIGAATAKRLGSRGDAVVVVARRKELLEQVARDSGPNALAIPADVNEREEVRRVVREALAKFGHIDVWINNAGQGISKMPTQLEDDDVDAMILANVKTALYGMQEVLPHFRERGSGQIINVSSMLGRLPYALIRSAYTGSKHFLNALTAMFREEVQKTHPGIQISLVSPGVVHTDFGLSALHGGPDSRTFPNAQTPDQVAAVLASVIDSRAPDVYTRQGAKASVDAYYLALGADAEVK